MLGQALALVILVSVVGGSVDRSGEAVVLMCAAGAAAMILQELNAHT